MLVMGLDPGIGRLGFAFANARRGSFHPARWADGHGYAFGIIETEKNTPEPGRLAVIQADMRDLIRTLRPDAVAVEELFARNLANNAVPIAQARGVAVAVCAAAGLPVFSYNGSSIKKMVTGNGKAKKPDIKRALEALFPAIAGLTRHDDADDALAVAYTHFLTHEHTL